MPGSPIYVPMSYALVYHVVPNLPLQLEDVLTLAAQAIRGFEDRFQHPANHKSFQSLVSHVYNQLDWSQKASIATLLKAEASIGQDLWPDLGFSQYLDLRSWSLRRLALDVAYFFVIWDSGDRLPAARTSQSLSVDVVMLEQIDEVRIFLSSIHFCTPRLKMDISALCLRCQS